VDGDARRVEVWTPPDSFQAFEEELLVLRPAGAGEPFTLTLAESLRRI
jgi:hypothetical protein